VLISALKSHPKIFGVVRNGDQLLANVSWKDLPGRETNGYFSFPISLSGNLSLSPYKAGYQFSPDIVLPSPENLRNLKIFNAVQLDPDFGLTDQYSFSKRIRNLKRLNDDEIIPYSIGFVQDENRGNCAFFSGKAYVDGGLKSRLALKPNFSMTGWIKPTELGENNCILGKGKDFVLKIRDIIDQAPNGKGFSYWGGEFIAFKGNTATNGSSWENQALWDFDHKALPVMEAFGD